jgi:hypothetical protein
MVNAINQSQRTAARVAGIAFLFTDVTATFAEFYVRPTLIVRDNAAQTAANIMAPEWLFRLGIAIQLTMIAGLIVLTVALYVVLNPASQGLALLAAFWRLTESALLAVGTLTSLNVLGLLGGAASLQGLQASQVQALAMRSIGAYTGRIQRQPAVRWAGHGDLRLSVCPLNTTFRGHWLSEGSSAPC